MLRGGYRPVAAAALGFEFSPARDDGWGAAGVLITRITACGAAHRAGGVPCPAVAFVGCVRVCAALR